MSELLEDLRETCCRFISLAFRLDLKDSRARRAAASSVEVERPTEIKPFINPWMDPPAK